MQNLVIFRENTDKYGDSSIFEAYYQRMPPDRQAKIDRMTFPKDKRLSLGAGVLLQQALAHAGMVAGVAEVGENGKPFFPTLKDRFRFNLSHSGSEVLCVANYGPEEVGCDIEEMREPDLRVAERFFHPGEYAYIRSFEDQSNRKEAFYRIWTLKESFLKVTGLGMKADLRSFEITIGEQIAVKQQIRNADYVFHSELDGEYALAWCMEKTN